MALIAAGTWLPVVPALATIALLLALLIVWKAVLGYRQNGDRALLLLAVGLFLLVLAPLLVEIAGPVFASDSVEAEIGLEIVRQVLRVAGLASILASMYVRR